MRPLLRVLISIHVSASIYASQYSNSVSVRIDFSQLEDDVITKNLHKTVGEDVVLRCEEDDRFRTHAFHWKFAKCARCEDVDPTALHWTDIQDGKKRLHIRNASIADSGRYICLDTAISTSYNLQVAAAEVAEEGPPSSNFQFQGRPPEIIGIEKSDAIVAHSTVLVKCIVSSPIAPLFRWLRRCDSHGQQCDFQYAGNRYSRLQVASHHVMRAVDGDYVSKLRMDNFTSADNGVYVCFTMTILGKAYQHFALAVSEAHEAGESASSLRLLFLIPAVFILVPIGIDCVSRRICARRKRDVILLQVLDVHI